jgi:hypothetical protein
MQTIPQADRSFTLPISALRAIANFASPADIRVYLDGVMVDVRADGARIVGTDGHTLGAYFVAAPVDADATADSTDLPPDESGPGTFVPWTCFVPLSVIKALPREKRNGYADRVCITRHESIKIDAEGNNAPEIVYTGSTQCGGVRCDFPQDQGRFPDYARVIPAVMLPDAIKPSNIDLSKFAQFVAAAKALGVKSSQVRMTQGGESVSMVEIGSEPFVGVVMPMRDSDGPTVRPEWIRSGVL